MSADGPRRAGLPKGRLALPLPHGLVSVVCTGAAVAGRVGDNSFNFELRVFVGSISYLLDVRNDLHMAVDDAFRNAGIEIAFPQHDIHIRSIDAAIPIESRSKMPPEGLEP